MARTIATKKLQAPQGPQSFTLPHNWVPRSYQREVFAAYERGYKRFVLNWHRRSGKDDCCLHLCTVAMADRPGLYLYIFPTKTLARDAIWQAVTRRGRFLDAFPQAWLDGEPNNTEMLIRVKPLPGHPAGSIWKLTGADDPNSLRGLNPVGVVLSEFAQHEANVWDEIVAPILNENDGWVIFNSTPLGRNHFHDIYRTGLKFPRQWYVSTRTVDDTRRDAPGEDGSPVVKPEVIAQERAEGRPEEIIQQESYCSFDGYQHGSILADVLSRARADGRIGNEPYEVTLPVGCAFDFGRDGTAVWFYQVAGRQVRVIDYAAFRRKGIDYLIKLLKDRKPYLYGRFVLPFDAAHEKFTDAPTIAETFEEHWPGLVQVVERVPIDTRIDMLRRKFGVLYFDETKCSAEPEDGMPSGLESLGNWRRAWDDKKQDFGQAPVHDEFSHGADALTYAAVDDFTKPEWFSREAFQVSDCLTEFNVFTHGRMASLMGR